MARLPRLIEIAQKECRAVLADLPPELSAHAKRVPLHFEGRSDEVGEEGDLLGLFEGASLMEEPLGPDDMPRISLYLESIWDACEGEEEWFLDEVRITLLHELGHYFGWDEEDLEERGLE